MSFKVVQITDTHLFSDPDREQKGVNTYQSFSRVVADVTSRWPEIDAVVLTGDLSQDETLESYKVLHHLCEPITVPIHAVVGNHDDKALLTRVFTGDGRYVDQDLILGGWRWFMLDTQVPGKVHGLISDTQMQHLTVELVKWAGHAVIAMHHPPAAVGSRWIDALACVNGPGLLKTALEHDVKVVTCGHVHQDFDRRCGGVRVLTTPSTCVQFLPDSPEFAIDPLPPGYRVFELDDSGQLSTEVVRVSV